MKKVTRNEVDFSEIFRFAEKEHGVGWNPCNDLFFRTEILHYKGYDDIYLEEMEANMEDDSIYALKGDERKATEILIDFMKQNKVKRMRVYNG